MQNLINNTFSEKKGVSMSVVSSLPIHADKAFIYTEICTSVAYL